MFSVEEMTFKNAQLAVQNGELSYLELTMTYMERIADIDKSGPTLNSVLELNPDALDIAEACDRERKQKGMRSPLHGMPILLKDNINTHDKMQTTAGSLSMEGHYAAYDAHLVAQLRKAGAVILGKANTTEYANYVTKDMKNGYSSRGGQAICPYNPEGDVSGSSTGSAVSVSANLCAAAVGTDTSGSIIAPAIKNGVVAIRPSKGLVSRSGIVPICTAQDSAGPVARTVTDAAALLGAMGGYDPEDPATWSREGQRHDDYTRFLTNDGLRGMRIGISHGQPQEGYQQEENQGEKQKLFENALQILKDCGAELVPDVNIDSEGFDNEVLFYEFKQCLNAYFSTCNQSLPNRTLKELIDFNNAVPDKRIKYGQNIFERAQRHTSGTLTEPEYLHARVGILRRSREQINKKLDENRLDIYIAPGFIGAPRDAGYPSIAVPIGLCPSDNMPYSITFAGRAFSEPEIIKAAYAFEQASKLRRVPDLSWYYKGY